MTPSIVRSWGNGARGNPEEAVATLYEPASELGSTAATGQMVGASGYQVVEVYPRERGTNDPVKYYWSGLETGNLIGRVLRVLMETSEEQTGAPGDAVTASSSWPALWEKEESDKGIRGVFSPPCKRKVLFSSEISIARSALKRLTPHVMIDSHRLESEDA